MNKKLVDLTSQRYKKKQKRKLRRDITSEHVDFLNDQDTRDEVFQQGEKEHFEHIADDAYWFEMDHLE